MDFSPAVRGILGDWLAEDEALSFGEQNFSATTRGENPAVNQKEGRKENLFFSLILV